MKRIDDFVDSIYKNVGGRTHEVEELKEEMRTHLLEAVDEFEKDGQSEQEAIHMAIERFGGEQEMRAVVGQLFKAQKVFAKRVLYIAVTFLVLTSVACGVLWKMDEADMHENLAMAERIASMLKGNVAISADMKQKLAAFVQENNRVLNVQVYPMEDVKRTSENNSTSYHPKEALPAFQYENAVSDQDWMLIDLGYDLKNSEWFVQMEAKRIFGFIPFVCYIGFAIYATLFTIWAIINAYHHRRFHVGWLFAFALFNVAGYLIYLLAGRWKASV